MEPRRSLVGRVLVTLVVCLSVAALGCAGSVDQDPNGSSGSAGTAPVEQGLPQGPGGATMPTASGGSILGPASGRRLTNVEYANTLGDLFGSAYQTMAAELDAGEAAYEGFHNDVAVSLVDSGIFAQLRSVAGKVSMALPAADLIKIAGCSASTVACQTQFIRNLGRSLYRRPLVDDDLTNLLPLFAVAVADASPFDRGARLVAQTMLQAPSFLYRLEAARPAGPDAFELATRLSYLLWASTPSRELLDAAQSGALTAPTLGMQVDALLADPKARRGLRVFADEWLALYRNVTVRRPRPDLGTPLALLADMRTETLDLIERVGLAKDTDLMSVFTDGKTRVTPALAKVYGVPFVAPGMIDVSTLAHRGGFLTQPGFLGINSGEAQASIVDRAMAVRDHLLCLPTLSTPKGLDVATLFAKTDPNLSERQRFVQHRSDAACAACHSQIEPLGYPFEVFDVVGRVVEKDPRGNALKGDGEMSLDGRMQLYKNVKEFAGILAGSPTVQACVAKRFARYGMGRVVASGEALDGAAPDAFKTDGRTYAALVRSLAMSAAFRAVGSEVTP